MSIMLTFLTGVPPNARCGVKPDHILDILGPILLFLSQNLDIFSRSRKADIFEEGGGDGVVLPSTHQFGLRFSSTEVTVNRLQISVVLVIRPVPMSFLFLAPKDSRAYTSASVPPTRAQTGIATCSGSMRVPHGWVMLDKIERYAIIRL